MSEPVFIVATLTVRADQADAFESFENGAAVVMRDHGGHIERAIRTAVDGGVFREVHVVSFPDAEALDAYRADPRMADLRPLRDASIVRTELLEGREGPDYGRS